MSTITRICPRAFGRAQSLCRGFSNRNIPVHRHSARDHQRVELAPWNDVFSPSSILPASFTSRFRDIEKMMRDMENVLEHKYLSFPARGEDCEVCECTPPPTQVHIWRDVYLELFIVLAVQNFLLNISTHISWNKCKYGTCCVSEMRSTFDAQKRCFPLFYTSIYKKVNDLGRPFFSREKQSKSSSCRMSFSWK